MSIENQAIISIKPEGVTPVAVKNSGSGSVLVPQATYNGGYPATTEIKLRIANGGAGQSGLIGEWANAFIQHCVSDLGMEPFKVGWCLGDTTESLGYLAAGSVDVAVTYNEAAEKQLMDSKLASKRVYGFRDHFMLVGPKANPADLDKEGDDVLTMFNKIVTGGNADVITPPDPAKRPAIRFLSRFDKSATNIKESELFITIGQVRPLSPPLRKGILYLLDHHIKGPPVGTRLLKMVPPIPALPFKALEAASLLSEYTLTDRGTWLSSPSNITSKLEIFKAGSDDAEDPLLNPAHVLLGRGADLVHRRVWGAFMEWVVSEDGGQEVIKEFKKFGEVLYSQAPREI